MRYIYIDVLILRVILELSMDYLLLWATAEVSKLGTTRTRLFLGASAGAIYSTFVFLGSNEIISGYHYATQFAAKIGFSVLMLLIAFFPVSLRRLLGGMGVFYLIAFMSGGAAIAAVYLTNANWIAVDIVAMGTILIVAEMGWGVIQKKIWRDLFHVPIEIQFGDKCVTVEALVDTGNQLRDPLTGTPVLILESSAMKQVLPEELEDIMELLDTGDFISISERLMNSSWSSRFRIIPYASIGKERGLLIGFRPTVVRILDDRESTEIKNVVVGIHNRQLSPEGSYKALLHPDIFQAALSKA